MLFYWESRRPLRPRPQHHVDVAGAPQHAPSLAYALLMALVGSGVRPTPRGLAAARLALLLAFVGCAALLAYGLAVLAGAIIDPTPYG